MRKFFDSVSGALDGRPIQNAEVRLYMSDGVTAATMYSGNGSGVIEPPLLTNTLGYFEFYATDGSYKLSVAQPGGTPKVISDVEIYDDSDQAALIARAFKVPEGEAGGVFPSVATRANKFLAFDAAGNPTPLDGTGIDPGTLAQLAADGGVGLVNGAAMLLGLFSTAGTKTVPSAYAVVQTSGYAVVGIGAAEYIYDATVDAAYVTAHPRTSFVSANGRGFRLDMQPNVTAEMLGGSGDLVQSGGVYGSIVGTPTDNLAPLNSAVTSSYYSINDANRRMSPSVAFGPSGYYLSGTFEPLSTVHLEGQGGGADNVVGSILRFPSNTVGFRLNDYNTLGGAYTSTGHPTTNGSKLRHLYLLGGGGTDRTKAGIRATATFHAEHLTLDNFAGRGIDLSAHDSGTGSDYGNTNGWFLGRVTFRAIGGDAALWLDRNNCNAGVGIAVQIKSAQNAGVIDSAAYTNNHIGYEFDSHGLSRKGCVQHNGGAWLAVTKDTAALSTTEPGTDYRIWHYYAALASPNGSWPAWVSGGDYMSGIAFIADSTDNRGVLLAPYIEASDQGLISTGDAGMIVIGGNGDATPDSAWLFRGLSGASNAIYSNVGIGGRRNHRQDPTALATYGTDSSIAIGLYLGSEYLDLVMQNGLDGRLSMQMVGPQVGTGRFGLGTQGTGGAANFWFGTGARSTELFGCTTAFQFFFMPTNFIVPDRAYSRTNSRRMSSASSMPSSGEIAQGEIVANRAAGAGGVSGWQCITGGVAGSTAVLKAMANLAA